MSIEYTNFCAVFSELSDIKCADVLLNFAKRLDVLTPTEWHAVGDEVADFRSAIAFQCASNSAVSVIGSRWENIHAAILAEANRYLEKVVDTREVRELFCAHRIKNIGHGVSGAVAEIVADDRLALMGLPIFFGAMFSLDEQATRIYN